MKRVLSRLVLSIAVATLFLVAALAIPRNVAAQNFGPGVDEVVFSIVPLDQAVQSTTAGDTDVYIFGVDTADDKIAARDDPNIATFEAFSSINDMLLNPVPHAAGVPGINPFQFKEVRKAMHYAFSRDFVLNDVYGGFGVPWVSTFMRNQPDWTRDAGFFFELENDFSYDPARAKAAVTAKLATVQDVTFDTDTNLWLYQGAPIEVNLVQRVEDLRFDIGAYIATELEALGFVVNLDPSTGLEAFFKVYVGDSRAGVWHVYTEGWLFGAIVQFDDSQPNFFFNGDFGSDWWQYYTPPPSLTVPCVGLDQAFYTSLQEREDLLRACTIASMDEGVRIFLLAINDVAITHSSITGSIFDVGSAYNNWFSLKTAVKNGQTGGSLQVHQPIHTVSGWNNVGGFTWIYEEYQRKLFSDAATPIHPHTGTTIPVRATYEITTQGPAGTLPVPADALMWDASTNSFTAVGAGVVATSEVTYTFNFGQWHHGMDITLDDIRWSMSEFFRIADPAGDLAVFSPSLQGSPAVQFVFDLFKGIKFDEAAGTVTTWGDYWNFDENLIAAVVPSFWTTVPWEVGLVMAQNVLDGDSAYGDDDASNFGVDQTDLVKGTSLASLAVDLGILSAANARPPGLDSDITAAEATARWAALNQWMTDRGHLYVSNGPFYVDAITTAPEGTVLKAFRTGYPIDMIDEFGHLTNIVKADVNLATPPRVVQTFPATFQFTTTFQGQAYDNILTSAYLVSDPGTGAVLFTGDATRTGPGAFDIALTAAQTSILVQGSYELNVVVATTDSVIPTFASRAFAVQGVGPALLEDLTKAIDDQIALLEDEIVANTDAINSANAAALAAAQFAQTVLILAVVGIVVGIIGVVLVFVRGRQAM